MSLYELLGTVEVGLIFGLVALGAFITFKILDFPDLTVEGSFPLGAAVVAVLIVNFGCNPWLATLVAAAAGFCAGFITAYLNVRFNILHILSGILISISLYSINLRIMGGPNKPLLGANTIFSVVQGFGLPPYVLTPLLVAVIVGMSLLPVRSMAQATLACLIGALLYRFAVAFSLNAEFLGLKASDVQLVTAILVVVTLVSQTSRSGMSRLIRRKAA